jgi:hypothetical protein
MRPAPTPILRDAALALAGAALLLAGCGGGGGGAGGGSSETVAFGVTDAASEEVASFVVGVQQITLRKVSGGTVTVLPAAAQVDLAQLVDVTDLIAVRTVPAGVYDSLDLSLDWTGAACQLSTPTATGPATLRRPDGTPLTGTVVETVDLGRRPLVLPGRSAQVVELDFNLHASLEVDAAANAVTVSPVILATVEVSGRKPVRVPGVLADIDIAASTFVVDFRPRVLSPTHGTLTAVALDTTVFVIDNVVQPNRAAGLVALSGKFGQRVLVGGVFAGGRLEASFVLAGTTLPQATRDLLNGVITSRTPGGIGDFLTVRGAFVSRASGGIEVLPTATAVIGPGPVVVYTEGATVTTTADALDVGAHVSFFGTWDPATKTLGGIETARRKLSSIVGTVKGPVSGGNTVIDLVRVGPFPASAFSPGGSWSPSGFTIANGPFIGIGAAGTPVRAVGLFSGFASGADPDFALSKALVNRAATESALGAYWARLAAVPQFLVVGSTGPSLATFDLRAVPSAGTRRAVYERGLVTAEDRLGTPAYRVSPRNASGAGLYAITTVAGSTRTTRVYLDFADFASDMVSFFQGTPALREVALVAFGQETSAGNDLAADAVFLTLKD